MPLTRKLQRVLEELEIVEDPQERLSILVDRARKVPPLTAELRSDAHRVQGCVSVVWLVPEIRDGRCVFRADAESPMVRALVVFLCDFFSGFTPADIIAQDADPLDALGVARNLSPTRRNGLNAARSAIRAFAAQYASARG